MIDWLDLEFPYDGQDIIGGMLQRITVEGEIDFERSQWATVKGSYASGVQVKAECGKMRISGNPAKLLSGQNVFSVYPFGNDVRKMAYKMIKKVLLVVGGFSKDRFKTAITECYLHRIDFNEMFQLPDQGSVQEWLALVRQFGTGRQQLTTGRGSTVYIGQKSRRKAWKFYSKFDELDKHPPHVYADQHEICKNFAWGTIRAEIVLRGMWLASKIVQKGNIISRKKNKYDKSYFSVDEVKTLRYLRNWGKDMGKLIYLNEIKKTNLPTHSEQLFNISESDEIQQRDRAYYLLWKGGNRLESTLPRATYYRIKKRFREEYGIDIASNAKMEPCFKLPMLSLLIGQTKQLSLEELQLYRAAND